MPAGKDTLEVQILRRRATELGLKLHNRTGPAKLRAAIAAREAELASEKVFETDAVTPSAATQEAPEVSAVPAYTPAPAEPQKVPEMPVQVKNEVPPEIQGLIAQGVQPMTEEEYLSRQRTAAQKECGRLVRCRITCMNPHKKNVTGEIISVGSSKVGTYKKFIPFNVEEPYHIPKIIFDYLKEKKCRIGTTVKLPNGQEVNRYKLVNEFALEVLPPLNEKELADLAQRQAMAAGGE